MDGTLSIFIFTITLFSFPTIQCSHLFINENLNNVDVLFVFSFVFSFNSRVLRL